MFRDIKLPKCRPQSSGWAKPQPVWFQRLWFAPLGCMAHSRLSPSFCWSGSFPRKFSVSSVFVFAVLGIAGPQHCSTFVFKWVFMQMLKTDEKWGQGAYYWGGLRTLNLLAVLGIENCQSHRDVCVCGGGRGMQWHGGGPIALGGKQVGRKIKYEDTCQRWGDGT